MTERDRLIAKELKGKIAQIAPLVDFRVFGSRARGDADEDSDLDVFIELETTDRELESKISNAVWEVGINNGCIVISPLVFSRYEIEESPLRVSPIVKAITEEGVRI